MGPFHGAKFESQPPQAGSLAFGCQLVEEYATAVQTQNLKRARRDLILSVAGIF